MQEIFDPIRQKWVIATPEEKIRQALVKKMIEELGYQKNLLGIEKSLESLSKIENKIIPKRRIDIIAYKKDIHPSGFLCPLLIIECKAVSLDTKVLGQIAGYNFYIGALFMAIANEKELKLFWKKENGVYETLDFLPSYEQLISSIKIPIK